VIVDNVWKNESIEPLMGILQYSKTTRMLITTQLSELLRLNSSKRFWLKTVDANKGVEFLKKQVGGEWNDQWSDVDAKRIVEKTSGVTLFLSEIASLLDDECKDALKLILYNLEKDGTTMESFYLGAFTKPLRTYGNSGLGCLQLSIESIKEKRLRNRYIMLGVFSPEIPLIPFESLQQIWNMDSIYDVQIAVGLYKNRSLLERTNHGVILHGLQRRFLVELYQTYCREGKEGFPVDN